MSLEIVSFVNEGLGHSSYLVDLGDGRALIIDPPRLPSGHLSAAAALREDREQIRCEE